MNKTVLASIAKKISWRVWLMFIVVFGITPCAICAPPITYLGIEQGLSNNAVRCIFQDHYGFIWFGTYDGLNRYDAYNFKVFRNRINDSTSLVNNWITAIGEDGTNQLWIGTRQGLNVYSHFTDKFSVASYIPHGKQAQEKIDAGINDIVNDGLGNILLASTSHGLLVSTSGSHTAVQVPFINNGKPEYNYNVQALLPDGDRVWMMINQWGLHVYNRRTDKISFVSNAIYNASCFTRAANGNIWIGNDNGVFEFDVKTGRLTRSFNETNGLKPGRVADLCTGPDNKLWVAIDGGGVNIIDPDTGAFEYLQQGEEKNTLTSNAAYALYADKDRRMWIGTLRGGINLIDPWKSRFQTVSRNPLNRNTLVSNFILSFFEDGNSNLWIGTDGDGISKWDRKQNTFTAFTHRAGDASSLSSNFITSITADTDENVWVAMFRGGINRYNKASNSFINYPCINAAGGTDRGAWNLYNDKAGNLWAGFVDGNLYRFNRQTNRFDDFDKSLYNVLTMFEDSRHVLWGGNFEQLIKIDRQGRQHSFIDIGRPVRAIHEDRSGHFWIGTEGGGLLLFNRDNNTFSRYTTADGLCNDAVLNILEDDNGNLWLSTFNGISKFDPKTKKFENFYQADGLQSNQFNYNAAIKLHDGRFVFGGIKGFNIFNPDSISSAAGTPPLVLTQLNVNNASIYNHTAYITRNHNGNIQAITIPYNQAVVSFSFAALEYSAPNKITYAYYLDGWDKDWTYTGSSRSANYTNLREGTYTFRVKATNSNGAWVTPEISVRITVLPPWYRSWWAYLLYTLVAVSLIYIYLTYKARQARLRYEIKLAQVNAEKEREINEKKLSFFTDVSHEFRTPLSLIINPIKDVLNRSEQTESDHKELSIVYRNARRLLSLVDQLLLFRKADTDADVLNISQVNFTSLCQDVYLSFVQQARMKLIKYEFECDAAEIPVYADKEKIEIALFNLFSNALKYTPNEGRVVFSVRQNNDEVIAAVADSGPGIPPEAGSRLFDKFYRSKATITNTGFGIGLYLVKHFVEKHFGKVSYESRPEKGSTFYITLKKGKEHFAGYTIIGAEPVQPELLQELAAEPAQVEEKDQLDGIVTNKPSLLVVDDDLNLLDYITEVFKDTFVVYTANNGTNGLELVKQNTPDIIISDINMAGMDGLELCKAVKSIPALRHTPFILLTGSSSTETQLRGVELGADDYITKPFEKDLLVARVNNILKSRDVLKEYFYNEITLQENTLKVSSEYKEFLDNCIKIVEAHLDDDQFTIQTLAAEMGMSHSALYKKIKAISGQTTNGFVRYIRLRKAAELFISTNCNINEAAFQVGINDIKYFRSQFNKLFGMNPSEYIKKFRKPFNRDFTLSDKAIRQ